MSEFFHRHRAHGLSQEELARIVKDCLVNQHIQEEILSLPHLQPVLALALAHAWIEGGWNKNGLDALERYERLTAKSTTTEHDRRSLLLIQSAKARCSPLTDRLSTLPDIIHQFSSELGPIDTCTVRLRYSYACCLRLMGKIDAAASVFGSLHQLLLPVRVANGGGSTLESHVFYEALNPDYWIHLIKSELKRLQRSKRI